MDDGELLLTGRRERADGWNRRIQSSDGAWPRGGRVPANVRWGGG